MPASFDLGSLNLSDLGVTGAAGGLGGRVGPTGTVSLTSGNKTVDSLMGIGAKLANVPISQNLLGLAARMAPSVLGPLAATAGLAGLPLAFAQLVHSIATAIPGTTAFQISEMMSNPHLTEEDVSAKLQDMAVRGAFPMQGGPQSIGALPMDTPVTNVNASTQAGPAGATLSHAPGQTFSEALAESMTPTPTFANLAQALGLGREDVGFTPSQGPTGPGESGTGPPGDSGGGDAGTGPF